MRWGAITTGLVEASTPLGDGFDNEAFWVSVVHFFVNNQRMLHRSYVQPIYDYIHHHKYRPQQIHRPDGSEGWVHRCPTSA